MSTPASRTPKRQRKKEGAQARRAAELAVVRRQQRNRRIIRFAIVAGVVGAALVAMSTRGGNDKKSNDQAALTSTTTGETTTSVRGAPVKPLECAEPDGSNTDLTKKPIVAVPAEPATELSCRDLVVGTGRTVRENDSITVQYVGNSQSNGKQFDASWDRGGEPTTFSLARGSLIDGWVDGIPGMKVGGRRVLTIPGDKAYGPSGRPPDIGPNDTLVFIIDVTDAKPA